jgi:tRNA(Ile)-lysidine synthetase-like protein
MIVPAIASKELKELFQQLKVNSDERKAVYD